MNIRIATSSAAKLLLLLTLWVIAKDTQVVAGFMPSPSICEYRESTGDQHRLFTWTLEEDNRWLLTSKDGEETHKAWVDEHLNTYRWSFDRPGLSTSISAWRKGEILHIEGTKNGRPYHREHSLGMTPWYQALSISLRSHLGDESARTEFWSIRPDNFDLLRMQIAGMFSEELETGSTATPVYRVEIRPAGWKAPFWKGEYWFRRSDGHFIRYRGDSGPPGSPKTLVEPSSPDVQPEPNR